jgi:hypothetical protein
MTWVALVAREAVMRVTRGDTVARGAPFRAILFVGTVSPEAVRVVIEKAIFKRFWRI